MMRERQVLAGGAAVIVFVLLVTAYVVIAPYWVAGRVGDFATQSMGRGVSVAGGSHLDMSPLSIRLEDVKLSVPGESADSFISAKSVVVPVSLHQLLSRQPDFSSMTLRDAEIALLIDERGQASWEMPPGILTQAITITLERASLRYFDARNNQSLALDRLEGLLEIQPDGSLSFDGSVVVDAQVMRLNASLKSITRVNQDGSPLDLALAGESTSLTFSGRLSTARVLSLSGPVSASGTRLLQFLGLGDSSAPTSIDGALDTAGRAFALRTANLTTGSFAAKGDLAVDLRGVRPRIQAKLAFDTLPLDLLVPAAGASPGEWGRNQIPFVLLRNFDADMTMAARAARYGVLSMSEAQLVLKLADGKLSMSARCQVTNGGSLTGSATIDTAVLPPQLTSSIEAKGAEVHSVLTAIFGLTRLSGIGDISAILSASGTTQEEMIGTLKGEAQASISPGEITGSDLPALLAAAARSPAVGWGPEAGATAFTSLVGQVSIADGVASVGSLVMSAGSATINVSGFSDLLRRAVDLSMTLTTTDGSIQPIAVSVAGKWASPAISRTAGKEADPAQPASGN